MALTLVNMRTAVRARLGVTSSDALFDDTTLTNFINQAIHTIETMNPDGWWWLETTSTISMSTSTESYTVPTDWAKTIDLILSSGGNRFKLEKQSPRDAADNFNTTATGTPNAYFIFNGNIRPRPIPDAAYSVEHRYIKTETDLSGDSDAPLIPDRFRVAIVELATAMAYRRAQNGAGAAASEAEFNNWIQKMLLASGRNVRTGQPILKAGGTYDNGE